MPLVVAGWGQWRRLAISAALAPVAFAVTSPFFVVHLSSALGDVRRVQELGRRGWLGFEDDWPTPIAFVDRLWEGMGPALLVALLGLVLALIQRTHADKILAAFVLVLRDAAAPRRPLRPLRAPARPALGALAGRVRWPR